MPHAALWVVQHQSRHIHGRRPRRFNAARGFVGGAASPVLLLSPRLAVSMPHAALWVVQQARRSQGRDSRRGFNAARGFVGGAAFDFEGSVFDEEGVSMPHAALWVVQHRFCVDCVFRNLGFNAARGFVGGAASSLSALVPLRGKRPFGKSPEI